MEGKQSRSLLGTEEQPLNVPDSDEKTLSVLTHVLTLIASFLAPLIIYLVKKDSAFVTDHSKESLNFQITMIVLLIISSILTVILIGFLLLWLLGLLDLVLVIVAGIRASEGKLYRYPFNLRLIK